MRNLYMLGGLFLVLLTSSCARVNLEQGKHILWIDPRDPERIVRPLRSGPGQSAYVTRDSTGEKLLIDFSQDNGPGKLVIISSEGIKLKESQHHSYFDDAGEPVWWYDRKKHITQFASGYELRPNVQLVQSVTLYLCNGKYAAFRSAGKCWVASIAFPERELVVLPTKARLQLIAANGDSLHLFYDEPKENLDQNLETILKYRQYEINGTTSKLVSRHDFDWTRVIYDFDVESGVMLVRSLGDKFAHAWLAEVSTGTRSRVGPARRGLFLEAAVIQEWSKALSAAKDHTAK